MCTINNTVRVVTSTVHCDHKAVVTYYAGVCNCKYTEQTYRLITPAQHASFLQYLEQSDTFDTNKADADLTNGR